MLTLKRTDSTDPDFVALVRQLDQFLAHIDGDEHAFYAQYNKVALLPHTVVAYADGVPVASGAIKPYEDDAMEVKRMYTLPDYRGQRIAAAVLAELEAWAKELGAKRCILETGNRQPEAIALYTRQGYGRIPNFGQYEGVYNSVCFDKTL